MISGVSEQFVLLHTVRGEAYRLEKVPVTGIIHSFVARRTCRTLRDKPATSKGKKAKIVQQQGDHSPSVSHPD